MDDGLLLPAPEERETRIHGYPDGFWLNYVSPQLGVCKRVLPCCQLLSCCCVRR